MALEIKSLYRSWFCLSFLCLSTICLHFLLAEPNPKILEQEPINRHPYNLASQIKEGVGEHGVWIRLDTQIKASTPALLKLMTVLRWVRLEPPTKQVNVIIWLFGSKILPFWSYWVFCSLSIWKIWKTAISVPLSTTVVNSPLLNTSAQVIYYQCPRFRFLTITLDFTVCFGMFVSFAHPLRRIVLEPNGKNMCADPIRIKTWVEFYASEQWRVCTFFSLPERFVFDYMCNLRDGLIFRWMLLEPHDLK